MSTMGSEGTDIRIVIKISYVFLSSCYNGIYTSDDGEACDDRNAGVVDPDDMHDRSAGVMDPGNDSANISSATVVRSFGGL